MKIMSKGFLILFVSMATSNLFAQNNLSIGYQRPQTKINTFVQKVERAGDNITTIRTSDGGYLTASQIEGAGFLLRKIKASGQKQWERRWDDVDDDSVSINGIAQTSDGGFVLAGLKGCESYWDCGDFGGAILIKLRTDGTVAWKKFVAGGYADYNYIFTSVIPMHDGGVIAIGRRIPDRLLVVRVTSTGDVVWKKNFEAKAYSIDSTATGDNGLIVTFSSSNSQTVMKITDSGNVVWTKSLNGAGFASKVGVTADGGVIVVGIDSNKLKVIVLNAVGTLRWNTGYSKGAPGRLEYISSFTQTHDGGYVITSSIYDISVHKYYGFITKIDSSGKVAFRNSFGNGLGATTSSVFATADGGFLLFGSRPVASRSSDLLVVKVNSEGIVPGCFSFRSFGTTINSSFDTVKISPVNIKVSNDAEIESLNTGMISVATNYPVSTLCK